MSLINYIYKWYKIVIKYNPLKRLLKCTCL